jgi:hypothetical protein
LKNCIKLYTTLSNPRKNWFPRNWLEGSFPELNDWFDSLKKFSMFQP